MMNIFIVACHLQAIKHLIRVNFWPSFLPSYIRTIIIYLSEPQRPYHPVALQVWDTCKRVLCAVSFCEENNLDWSSWQTNKVTTQLHLCLTESAFCNGAHSMATEPMKHIYFLVKHLSESVKFVVNNRLLSSSPNVQSS